MFLSSDQAFKKSITFIFDDITKKKKLSIEKETNLITNLFEELFFMIV